jgi:UDP-N-acetylmuramate dehydrogenase
VSGRAVVDDLARELEARLGDCVERDVPLAGLTTYRLGGPVAVLVRVRDRAALATVATALHEHPAPLLLVGRGSNLLVADRGFEGLGVVLEGCFDTVELDAGPGVVRAGGAVALPVLARRASAAGLAGLEFFVGIPGSVGGAVRMNAGGHGRETVDVLVRAWTVDLAVPTAETVARSVDDLDLGYRRSRLSDTEVVTGAELAVVEDAAGASEELLAEVVRWRREHQPGGSNAGSVFRNPPGDSAGRIIDAAGLKGLRVGGALVSPKHANFFQAEPGATAGDVRRLVLEVRRRVAAEAGIALEPELRMIGFEDS